MKNRKNNKGFSLVELIVVVAIMAVLVGVLTPQYMKYIERTRLQKDNTAIAEVAEAIKIAMADELIYSETSNDQTIVIKNEFALSHDATTGTAPASLKDEVSSTIGTYKFVSKNYKDKEIKFYVKKADTGTVNVAIEGFIQTPGGAATTATNPIIY